MRILPRTLLGAIAALALAASAAAQDLKVGLSVSLSGPNSSLGVPYANGMKAAIAMRSRRLPKHPARGIPTR